MSTNINTNTPNAPETAPPQGTNGAQGAPSTGPVGFQSGNAANTTAILALISAMMKLYEFKNTAFVGQAKAESAIAKNYADSQEKLGTQEMTELEIQGAFSAVSGLFTAGLGMKGMMEESSLSGQQKEITASNDFVKNLDKDPEISLTDKSAESSNVARGKGDEQEIEMQVMSEVSGPEETDETEVAAKKVKAKARLEEMITELKNGSYKMTEKETTGTRFINRKTEYKAADPAKVQAENHDLTDQDVITTLSKEPELDRLKDAAKENIAVKQKKLDDDRAQVRLNFDKRNMASTAVSGVFSGAGNIGAGVLKQQQGKQQSDNTEYQTAQQQFQSLARETESQSDKDLQTAESLTQLIPELDKSNNAILSA